MFRTRFVVILLLAVVATVPALSPVLQATHVDRIVLPYGQAERHVPVIAGYELAPRPLACNVGTGVASGVLYQNSFDGGMGGLSLSPLVHIHGSSTFRQEWHVTSFAGKGTDGGHSAGGRLYFGNDATGVMGFGGQRVGGVASLPAVTIPAQATYLSWNEKFEQEALLGYDHMWVEIFDGTRYYVLCSSDVESRPDPSSSEQTFGACSPYTQGPCPTSFRTAGGLVPLYAIDPTAPHWHSRFVEIPSLFYGKTIQVRFSWDSSDGVSNNFLGWMVDDVMISDEVVPKTV